jgi:hypothetical protein
MAYACELVLRNGSTEARRPHTFSAVVGPGTEIHFDGTDWMIVEVNERQGLTPEVVAFRSVSSA